MEIRILCENLATGMVWQAKWGFSALIGYGDQTILFDTGFSDIWQRNAAIAEIDLDTVNMIALSHFHRDHTRGLLHHQVTDRKRLILHPRILTAVLDTDDKTIHADYARIHQVLSDDFDIQTETTATQMMPGAWFLGEIPRVTPFERGAFFDDPMPDDTALAFEIPTGVVIVSGCAHAGICNICNICEHAMAVTGLPLRAVIGGFHLMAAEDPPIEATIDYFRRMAPELLLPMHCVEFEYMAAFHAALGTPHVGAGEVIPL